MVTTISYSLSQRNRQRMIDACILTVASTRLLRLGRVTRFIPGGKRSLQGQKVEYIPRVSW